MVTGVGVATAEVVMGNEGETLAPPGMVTEAGTEAACGFELESEMTTPFDGAGPLRETVLAGVLNPP